MNLVHFRLRPAPQKLRQVLTTGRYLMQRTDPRRGVVSLWYLAEETGTGVFAEVDYDTARCRAVLRRLFRKSRRLYRFVAGLCLPGTARQDC